MSIWPLGILALLDATAFAFIIASHIALHLKDRVTPGGDND